MKVAVVGAGPAGLATAWKLAEQNHQVCVFERKVDLTTQGSGVLIQSIGLAALKELGVLSEVEALGRRLKRVDGYTKEDRCDRVIGADYTHLVGNYQYALGIQRGALWSVLHQRAVAVGVEIIAGVTITGAHRITNRAPAARTELKDSLGNIVGTYDLVIDASGAFSKLRHCSGVHNEGFILPYGSLWTTLCLPIDSQYNTDAMTIFTGERNQGIGLIPTGQAEPNQPQKVTLFFNLNWRKAPRWNNASFLTWKRTIIRQWPTLEHLLEQLTHHEQLYLAKFRHYTMHRPYAQGIVYIGDAAHCSSPQLGQGVNMSLVDAVALVKSIESEQNLERAVKKYARRRKLHVLVYQTLANLLRPFYQSDNFVAVAFRDHVLNLFFRIWFPMRLTAYILSGQLGHRR